MRIKIYDSNLKLIAIPGDQYISCLWAEGYNSVQPCCLELNAIPEYKKLIRPGCYLGRFDRNTLAVVRSVGIKDGKIVISGVQASACLDDVPFIGKISSQSPIAQIIKTEYDKGEKYPHFEIADSPLPDRYQHDISHKSFLQLEEIMCQSADMGFRAVKSGDLVEIQHYKPKENENLRFSEAYGNLSVTGINLSEEGLKNVAIVLGEGEWPNRIRVDVDQSDGEQKRYLILDARNITRDQGESEASYKNKLSAYGSEKLLEHKRTWECLFSPVAADFGTRYDLGDILTILLPEYDLKLQARVIRFAQKAQQNSSSTTIEVGEIKIVRR